MRWETANKIGVVDGEGKWIMPAYRRSINEGCRRTGWQKLR